MLVSMKRYDLMIRFVLLKSFLYYILSSETKGQSLGQNIASQYFASVCGPSVAVRFGLNLYILVSWS